MKNPPASRGPHCAPTSPPARALRVEYYTEKGGESTPDIEPENWPTFFRDVEITGRILSVDVPITVWGFRPAEGGE
jgi:hypothetical protein